MLNLPSSTKFIFLIKCLTLLILILIGPLATLEARAETRLQTSSSPVCPTIEQTPLISPTSDSLAGDIVKTASTLAERVLSKLTPHERTNILLLGSDTWATDDNYGHTDSIVVVTLDPTSKRAAMLSIPRDLWVSIPGYGENRINQAYRLGEIKQHSGGGPGLIKETIEANFGISIDHYALVKFTGFAQIIDMMGGIEVCVPETLDAASYYGYPATTINKEAYYSFVPASTVLLPESDPAAALDPSRGYEFLYIEAGRHTLDGNTALQYARSRASITADFARVQRQQAVLMAMRSKALQMDLIPKIPELWYAMQATYQTDLTLSDVLTLAQLAGTIAADHIQTLAISHDQTQGYRTPEGAQVLLPNRAAIQTLIGDVFAVTIPQTSPTQLEVKAVQPTDPIPNTVLPATAAVWIK